MQPLLQGQRYRCKSCGNLTRFNVKVTRTILYYHHQALDGSMTPEEEEVIREEINEVACRWCGHGKDIEVMEGPDTA